MRKNDNSQWTIIQRLVINSIRPFSNCIRKVRSYCRQVRGRERGHGEVRGLPCGEQPQGRELQGDQHRNEHCSYSRRFPGTR